MRRCTAPRAKPAKSFRSDPDGQGGRRTGVTNLACPLTSAVRAALFTEVHGYILFALGEPTDYACNQSPLHPLTLDACMRLSSLFAAALTLLAAGPTFALQLPTPEDPRARAALEEVGMTIPKFESLLKFARPAPSEWPCKAELGYLYQQAGLWSALPLDQLPDDLRAQRTDVNKMTRKMLRSMNFDPNSSGDEKFSNIELIPIKAQCVDGKLDGPVEYYAKFDSVREITTEMLSPLTNKLEKNRNVISTAAEVHIHTTFKAGKPKREGLESVRRATVITRMHFENPDMQKSHDKTVASMKPISSTMVQVQGKGGYVMFMPMDTAKVSSGFLGPKTTFENKMMTTIMLMGEGIQDSFTYTDADLTSTMRTNPETKTTAMVSYMDNFLTALGKKLSEMPNMENYREVNIGGRNLLEMRSCTVNGAIVKMDPCPVEP